MKGQSFHDIIAGVLCCRFGVALDLVEHHSEVGPLGGDPGFVRLIDIFFSREEVSSSSLLSSAMKDKVTLAVHPS